MGGPGQDRLYALAREVGVDTFPTHGAGENLIEFRGELKRYTGHDPAHQRGAVLADVGQAQKKLDRLARKVDVEAPWRTPGAEKLDSQTFWSWMRRNVYTSGGRMLIELGIEAVWAVEPADVSLLHVLFYIASAGNYDLLVDSAGGAQQDRFVGGSQLVAQRAAEPLGDALVLSAPVRRIVHRGETVSVIADGHDRWAGAWWWRSRPAGGPDRLRPAAAGPPRPADPAHADGLGRQVHGDLRRAVLARRRAERPGDERRRPGEGDLRQLAARRVPRRAAGLPGGQRAREYVRATPEERRDAVVGTFARLFGPRAAEPERYLDKAWAEEEWTRGCYGAYLPTGGWTTYGDAIKAPIGRIHWAGTETASIWMGYIDGAIRSGERVAVEVAQALGQLGVAHVSAAGVWRRPTR